MNDNNEIKEVFRKKLKQLRNDRGHTLEDMVPYIGVNKSTLSKYERGAIEPTLSVLVKISRYFGVTIDYLVNPNVVVKICIGEGWNELSKSMGNCNKQY